MTLEINPGDVLSNISTFPPNKRKEILELLHEYEDAKTREKCKDEYLPFVKEMWPAFISGNHHKIMADAFQDVVDGKLKIDTSSVIQNNYKLQLLEMLSNGSKLNDIRQLIADNSISDYSELYRLLYRSFW